MREHNHKKVNVLGVDVSMMRPERAVNLTMDMMREKGFHTIFFLSALGSLFSQNSDWAEEYIRSMNLILPGDRHTETAVTGHEYSESGVGGLCRFADEYFKRLFYRLNREYREIYVVVESQEYFDSLKEYLGDVYPGIAVYGATFDGDKEGEADKVVNEINAHIPDMTFLTLPVEQQLKFVKDYSAMMNTFLCVCIESVQPLIQKETEEAPGWVKALRLEGLYRWLKREQKIEKTIAGSIFKKKILDDVSPGDAEKDDGRKQPDESRRS